MRAGGGAETRGAVFAGGTDRRRRVPVRCAPPAGVPGGGRCWLSEGRWGRAESWGSGRGHGGRSCCRVLVLPGRAPRRAWGRRPSAPGKGRSPLGVPVAGLKPLSWERGGRAGRAPGDPQPRGFVRRSSRGGRSCRDRLVAGSRVTA